MRLTYLTSVAAGGAYAIAAWLAILVVVSANDVSRSHALLARALSPEAQTEAALERAIEVISLGSFDPGEERRAELVALNERVHLEWQRATNAGVLVGVLLTALIITTVVTRQDKPESVTRALLWTSTVCLAVGVLAPMLSITAQREVPVLGEVVLRYESKGIITSIASLYAHGNLFIAGALAVFSFVVPVLKLLLGFIAVGPSRRAALGVRKTLHMIGRWSMTDVFVVAILLSVLAGSAEDSTNAWLGHGLWFFAAYGVLSLIISQRLARDSADSDGARE